MRDKKIGTPIFLSPNLSLRDSVAVSNQERQGLSEADLSTSFDENGEIPPWFTLVRRKPVELPADLEMPPDDPQFDKLSPEALIAMAEGLREAGCSVRLLNNGFYGEDCHRVYTGVWS